MRTLRQGYVALFTLLVVGAVVSSIAVFLLLSGVSTSFSSRSVEANAMAKAAASGCANLALAAIQADTSLTTPANSSQTLNATTKQACTYAITGVSPSYTIVATGSVDASGANYTHRITITLSAVVPQLVISSWLDTP